MGLRKRNAKNRYFLLFNIVWLLNCQLGMDYDRNLDSHFFWWFLNCYFSHLWSLLFYLNFWALNSNTSVWWLAALHPAGGCHCQLKIPICDEHGNNRFVGLSKSKLRSSSFFFKLGRLLFEKSWSRLPFDKIWHRLPFEKVEVVFHLDSAQLGKNPRNIN